MPRLVLSPPPSVYNPDHERNNNRDIERAINQKLGRDELGVYMGTPLIVATGSSASFAVPNGTTPTKIPFNTIQAQTDLDLVFDTTTNELEVPYAPVMTMGAHIAHVAGGSGAAIDISLCLFVNGTERLRVTQTGKISSDFPLNVAGVMTVLAAGDAVTLRLVHNAATPVNFDLTKSRWTMLRMTPNPRNVPK